MALFGCVLSLAPAVRAADAPPPELPIGIEERLGQTAPLDLTFTDELGRSVSLRDLVDKPTVLALVYYHCPGICTPLLQETANVVSRVQAQPGKDFRVVTISFDPSDTPAVALAKKNEILASIGGRFPAQYWSFLTGKPPAIDAITEAVGFRYKPGGDKFVHASALFVLAADGKIAHYLLGTEFLPADLDMALREAARGQTTPTIPKLLRYCFYYDPSGRRYVLNLTRVTGVATLLFAALFVTWLMWSNRRYRERVKHGR